MRPEPAHPRALMQRDILLMVSICRR